MYMYVYLHIYLSIYLSIYLYICIYMCVCVCLSCGLSCMRVRVTPPASTRAANSEVGAEGSDVGSRQCAAYSVPICGPEGI